MQYDRLSQQELSFLLRLASRLHDDDDDDDDDNCNNEPHKMWLIIKIRLFLLFSVPLGDINRIHVELASEDPVDTW